MAYNENKPENNGFLADAPEELRNNFEGLKKEQIVDAGTLKGLSPGNKAGNLPIANGNLNTNLNADKLDGQDASAFALAKHEHTAATVSSGGFMANTDKAKLDSIQAGAEVNQNAFSNILVNGTVIEANGKSATFELAAGSNLSIDVDAKNNRMTIAVIGKVPTAAVANDAEKLGGKPPEAYAKLTDIPVKLPANGGNADTLGGKKASEFVRLANGVDLIFGAGVDERGDGGAGRAMVKAVGGKLTINYGNDFKGGVEVQSLLTVWGKQVATVDQIPTNKSANSERADYAGNADTVDGFHLRLIGDGSKGGVQVFVPCRNSWEYITSWGYNGSSSSGGGNSGGGGNGKDH